MFDRTEQSCYVMWQPIEPRGIRVFLGLIEEKRFGRTPTFLACRGGCRSSDHDGFPSGTTDADVTSCRRPLA
jgi:hypothetical protein